MDKNSILWKILDASMYEVIGLIVLIALLIGVIFWLKKFLSADEDALAADHLMLSQATAMMQEGELSEEEYKSIKGKLVNRLDENQQTPTPKPAENLAEIADKARTEIAAESQIGEDRKD